MRSKLSRLFEIDVRALAVFRICLAILLLFDLYIRFTDLSVFYTDSGVLPRAALMMKYSHIWFLSVHMLNGTYGWAMFFFLVEAFLAVGLLLGYRTRLMTLASWYFSMSLHMRNPIVLQKEDQLLGILLFWCLFIPLGEWGSLDSARNHSGPPRSQSVFSMGTVALLLQVAMVYIYASIYKWRVPQWHDGSAIYNVLNTTKYASSMGLLLREYPALMIFLTHAVLWVEMAGPIFLLSPFFSAPLRLLAVGALIVLQIGLASTMRLGIFPYIAMAMVIPFIPSFFWDKLFPFFSAKSTPVHPAKNPLWAETLVAVFLLCVVTLNQAGVYHFYTPNVFGQVCRALRFEQRWNMFTTRLNQDDWYVIPGKLKNGTEADILTGRRPIQWDKSGELLYKNATWRRYMTNLNMSKSCDIYRPYYAQYLCQSWNEKHSSEEGLNHFEVYFITKQIPPPGETATAEAKRNLLWGYSCVPN